MVVQAQVVAEPDDGHLAAARARARRLAAAGGAWGEDLRSGVRRRRGACVQRFQLRVRAVVKRRAQRA
jgi:hypothetical protein